MSTSGLHTCEHTCMHRNTSIDPQTSPTHPHTQGFINSRNLDLVCQRKGPLATGEWCACGLWFTRAIKYTAYFKYLMLRKNIKCHANNFYTCCILKW